MDRAGSADIVCVDGISTAGGAGGKDAVLEMRQELVFAGRIVVIFFVFIRPHLLGLFDGLNVHIAHPLFVAFHDGMVDTESGDSHQYTYDSNYHSDHFHQIIYS